MKMAESNKTVSYSPGKVNYDKDVEVIQTALQFLGFSLPKWGVDGKFGPETQNATKLFQKSVDLTEDGKIDGFDLRYLTAMLVIRKFSDGDLTKIQKQKEIDTGNITDKNFYERLLTEFTLKTLRNGYYDCIVNGLKNDIGASEIAKCPSLKTWGTGNLVAKVVRNYESGSSPNIKSLA